MRLLSLLLLGVLSVMAAAWSPPAPANEGKAAMNLIQAPIRGWFSNCNSYDLGGFCYCGTIVKYPCALRLRHRVPTVFVEVIRGQADSIFAQRDSASGARGSLTEKTGGFWNVRIWYLTREGRRMLTANISECAHCGVQHNHNGNYVEAIRDASMKLACPVEPSSQVIAESYGKALEAGLSGYFKLVYDSNADLINWHTGCRDLLYAACEAPRSVAQCGVLQYANSAGVTRITDKINSSVGQACSFGGRYPGVNGSHLCLGQWSPMYPRVGLSHGASSPTAAAIAGLKAFHTASVGLRTLGVEWGGTNMKLQPVYPKLRSTCSTVGSPAYAAHATAGSPATDTGRWGFLVWQEVGCCVGFDEPAKCLTGGAAGLDGLQLPELPELPGFGDIDLNELLEDELGGEE